MCIPVNNFSDSKKYSLDDLKAQEVKDLSFILFFFHSALENYDTHTFISKKVGQDITKTTDVYPLYRLFSSYLIPFYTKFQGKLLLNEQKVKKLSNALELAADKRNTQGLYRDIKEGILSIVPANLNSHRIDTVFYGNVYGIANAGHRDLDFHSIELFRIDMTSLTNKLIGRIQNINQEEYHLAQRYIYRDLPELLRGKSNPKREKFLKESAKKISPKHQKSGSCCIKSIKTSIRIAWFLYGEDRKESIDNFHERVVTETKAFFDFVATDFFLNYSKKETFVKPMYRRHFMVDAQNKNRKKKRRLSKMTKLILQEPNPKSFLDEDVESPGKRVRITPP